MKKFISENWYKLMIGSSLLMASFIKTRNFILLTSFLLTVSSYAQTSITLTKGGKKKIFNKEHELTYSINQKYSNGDSITSLYTGYIIWAKKDTLKLRLTWIEQAMFLKDELVWESSKTYYLNNTYYQKNAKTEREVSFNINDVYKIEKGRGNVNFACFSIGVLSAITAVIVSPLISINYKDGSFDTDKYAKITGISIPASGVFWAISLNTNQRKFKTKGGKKVWTLESGQLLQED
jgi:hypothetical protein